MPRGVPKAGFRAPRGSRKLNLVKPVVIPRATLDGMDKESHETDEQIYQKITDRFEVLQFLVKSALEGDVRALIVSGPPGLGKSFTVENELERWDPQENNYEIVKGYVRATGLYKKLYRYRSKGQVLVFDDADSIFYEDSSLNFLKGALDTSDRRKISYLSEGELVDEDTQERIPRSFFFDGTVIFITNYDFDKMIEQGSKLAPHLQALSSRSHYIDLMMKTRKDYIVRIKQVVLEGLLDGYGLSEEQIDSIVNFIETNQKTIRELSLRMPIKLAQIMRLHTDWERIARSTVLRVS
jgi:hypothetical protein